MSKKLLHERSTPETAHFFTLGKVNFLLRVPKVLFFKPSCGHSKTFIGSFYVLERVLYACANRFTILPSRCFSRCFTASEQPECLLPQKYSSAEAHSTPKNEQKYATGSPQRLSTAL